MQAHWQSALPGAALSVYEKLRNALAESLGIDPAEATQSLYLSILHSEPAPAPQSAGTRRGTAGTLYAIGRATELAGLLAPWSTAVAGGGGLCLVSGAAGMGKRTIIDELSARVETAGALVLRTACLEAERSLFLQPLVEVVRAVLMHQSPAGARDLLGEWAAPLAELIPDIGHILGPIPYERFLPEAHHRRVLEAFAGFLTRLERQRPVLLVVESLEHASADTLETLHFLGTRSAGHRILIVGTVDAAKIDRVVASLGDHTPIVRLGPLTLTDVNELVRRSKSRLDPVRLLELTGGSPLYLSELIRHEREFDTNESAPVPLPESLRAAITERLGAVGAEVVELLQLGSIFGDRFALDEVSSLGELRVEECARRVQRALQAHLVLAQRSSFGFANKILREVLYQSIPEPTRISRHRRAAALLADQPEAAAAQWAAAGAWADAIAAWRATAEAAHRALANVEAERLLTAAAQAARELGNPSTLADVLIRRGQIRCELARYDDAHDDQEAALGIARELLDDELEARALEQLGWTALYARDALSEADVAGRATKLAEAAVAAPGAPRSAWLLLGRVRHWDGDYEAAAAAYDRVLTDRPDDEIAAQALTFRGSLLQHMDRFSEARRTLAEAIVLCRSNGLIRPLLQALFFTALSLGDSGDFAGALRNLQRARRLIDDNGITYYSAGIDTTTSWLLRETGQLGPARDVAERAVEAAQRGGGALELEQGLHAVLAMAECSLEEGDVDGAGLLVEQAVPYLDSPLPYRARAHMRLLEMQARFEPVRAEELLGLARRSSSTKYEALALWHLGQLEEAERVAIGIGSDQLLAQVGAPTEAWQAILRIAEALPPDQRELFMTSGRLPALWRSTTGRVSG